MLVNFGAPHKPSTSMFAPSFFLWNSHVLQAQKHCLLSRYFILSMAYCITTDLDVPISVSTSIKYSRQWKSLTCGWTQWNTSTHHSRTQDCELWKSNKTSLSLNGSPRCTLESSQLDPFFKITDTTRHCMERPKFILHDDIHLIKEQPVLIDQSKSCTTWVQTDLQISKITHVSWLTICQWLFR